MEATEINWHFIFLELCFLKEDERGTAIKTYPLNS